MDGDIHVCLKAACLDIQPSAAKRLEHGLEHAARLFGSSRRSETRATATASVCVERELTDYEQIDADVQRGEIKAAIAIREYSEIDGLGHDVVDL